jgi:hypothetical protein
MNELLVDWIVVMLLLSGFIFAILDGMHAIVYLAWERDDYEFPKSDNFSELVSGIFSMFWAARSKLWHVAFNAVILSIIVVLK